MARRPPRRGRGRGRGDFTVRIEGIDRLRERIEALPDDVKDALRRAVREAAESVQADTRQAVRHDSGDLSTGVKVRYTTNQLAAQVGWRRGDLAAQYAAHHEFGTSSIPANPALTSAAEAERRRLVRRVTELVRRELP